MYENPDIAWSAMPPVRKERSAIKVVLIVAAIVLAVCGGGALAAFGIVGGGVATVEHESADRTADVTITGCEITVIDSIEVAYTIKNSSKSPRSYSPRFSVTTPDGTIVSDANDFTQSIAAGATYKGKAIGMLSDASNKRVTCKLVSA